MQKLWCIRANRCSRFLVIGIARFTELIENVIRLSHGHSTPSLKISCKSVQPFRQNTKRHRRQTDKTTHCTNGATDSTVGQKALWAYHELARTASSSSSLGEQCTLPSVRARCAVTHCQEHPSVPATPVCQGVA